MGRPADGCPPSIASLPTARTVPWALTTPRSEVRRLVSAFDVPTEPSTVPAITADVDSTITLLIKLAIVLLSFDRSRALLLQDISRTTKVNIY